MTWLTWLLWTVFICLALAEPIMYVVRWILRRHKG